ncbi:MAG TPA: hypothetical protein VF558_00315, partial [Rubrobacteraceae bacterium]
MWQDLATKMVGSVHGLPRRGLLGNSEPVRARLLLPFSRRAELGGFRCLSYFGTLISAVFAGAPGGWLLFILALAQFSV